MKTSVLLSVAIILLLPTNGLATHLRGGHIRVIPKNGLTCIIELTVYTNTFSDIKFGEGVLDFGDGLNETTPTIDNTRPQEYREDIGMVIYSVVHTYPGPGTYLISYIEANLAGGILNMFNSVETRFYTETSIVISPDGSYGSPEFPGIPIFVCKLGVPYSFSTAAIDNESNEFIYKYSLITNPKEITDFKLPESLKIEENNGMITWDTKFEGTYVQGQIWVVVKITRFSKAGDFLGYVQRAMQIIVEDDDSEIEITSPFNASSNQVIVTEGNEKVIKVVLSDDNYYGDLHFDLFSSKLIEDNVSLIQYDSAKGKVFQVAKLSFKTTPDIVSNVPYIVTLRGISNHMKDISFVYMTTDDPLPQVVTGIGNETEILEENVYPNPFHSELYIDGTEAILINSVGHLAARSLVQKGLPIDTSTLPVGFYILQVVRGDGTRKNIKLIKN